MEKFYMGMCSPGSYVSPYASLSDMVEACSSQLTPTSVHICKRCYDEIVGDDYDKDADCVQAEVMLSIQAHFKLSNEQVCQFMFPNEQKRFFALKEAS